MLTFHFGPLSRRARMFLQLIAGCLGMCILIGPSFLALAEVPPIPAATSRTPLRLLAVKPFLDLSAGGCFDVSPRVLAGPTALQGTIVGQSELNERLETSVFACAADGWTGDVTISATVDARGSIATLQLGGDVSPLMRTCLGTNILRSDLTETRGPGTLRASYFMGQARP
jgi:hypothetical protein